MSQSLSRRWTRLPRRIRFAILLAPPVTLVIVTTLVFQWVPQTFEDWLLLVVAAVAGWVGFFAAAQAILERLPEVPKPLMEPAKEGELLVVITRFQGPDELDPQRYTACRLESDLVGHPTLKGKGTDCALPKAIEGESGTAEKERTQELAEDLERVMHVGP